MDTLNKTEFIKQLLHNNDNRCEQLSEEHYQRFSEGCAEQIEVFKLETIELVKQYNQLRSYSQLNEQEVTVKTESEQSYLSLQKTVQLITASHIEITAALMDSQQLSPLYNSAISNNLLLQEKIIKNLQMALEESKSLSILMENNGLITLHKRLEFCTNVFFTLPYQLEKEVDFYNHYVELAKTLSEFWYNNGIEVRPPSSPDEGPAETSQQTDDLLLSLALLFTTLDYDKSVITQSCYSQLVNTTLSLNSHFILQQFARENPEEFIQLYDRLFYQENEFSKHLVLLLQEEHLFAMFNMALFQIQVSEAYLSLEKKELAQQAKTYALKKLVLCFENGLQRAEGILIAYLEDDTYLAELIELTTVYYGKDNLKAHALSQKIHQKIKDKSLFELRITEYEIGLLFFWVGFETNELYDFGFHGLFLLVEMQNLIAYYCAKSLAKNSPACAIRLAQIVLRCYGEKEWEQTLEIIASYQKAKEPALLYQQFCLQNRIDGTGDYTLFLKAAEYRFDEAVIHLDELCKNEDKELRANIYRRIIMTLDKESQFAYRLLEEHYFSGHLELHHYYLEREVIDKLILFFYPYLVHSKPDEALYFLEKLTPRIRDWQDCYEPLIKQATHHFPTALFLMEFWLKQGWTDKVINLHQKLLPHYEEKDFYAKIFCLHFTHGVRISKGFDTLLEFCFAGSKQSQLQIIAMVNYLVKNPQKNNSDVVRFDILPACISFLSELALKPEGYLASESLCLYFTKQKSKTMAHRYFSLCVKQHQGEELIRERLKMDNLLDVFVEITGIKTFPTQTNLGFFEKKEPEKSIESTRTANLTTK